MCLVIRDPPPHSTNHEPERSIVATVELTCSISASARAPMSSMRLPDDKHMVHTHAHTQTYIHMHTTSHKLNEMKQFACTIHPASMVAHALLMSSVVTEWLLRIASASARLPWSPNLFPVCPPPNRRASLSMGTSKLRLQIGRERLRARTADHDRGHRGVLLQRPRKHRRIRTVFMLV